MAYELYIYPPKGALQTMRAPAIVAAFVAAGLPCTEQPDQWGHWLVLKGFESTLDLTIKDGVVTYGGFRYVTADDMSIAQRVADVFKSVGFLVSDVDGEV